MTKHTNKACRKIAEHFLDNETIDIVSRVLDLEDDKRVSSVELEINQGFYGGISNIHARVNLARAFDNQEEFRAYLRRYNLPTEEAYQYCENSQTFDYTNKRGQTICVHFSQPDFRR